MTKLLAYRIYCDPLPAEYLGEVLLRDPPATNSRLRVAVPEHLRIGESMFRTVLVRYVRANVAYVVPEPPDTLACPESVGARWVPCARAAPAQRGAGQKSVSLRRLLAGHGVRQAALRGQFRR